MRESHENETLVSRSDLEISRLKKLRAHFSEQPLETLQTAVQEANHLLNELTTYAAQRTAGEAPIATAGLKAALIRERWLAKAPTLPPHAPQELVRIAADCAGELLDDAQLSDVKAKIDRATDEARKKHVRCEKLERELEAKRNHRERLLAFQSLFEALMPAVVTNPEQK